MSMQWFKHVVANAKHVQHHIIKHSYCLITMSYAPTCQLTRQESKNHDNNEHHAISKTIRCTITSGGHSQYRCHCQLQT